MAETQKQKRKRERERKKNSPGVTTRMPVYKEPSDSGVAEKSARAAGKNMTVQFSKQFSDDYHALVGLGANSWDAGADNLWYSYDPTLDQIVIEDNGQGMDKKGIDSYFRNAGSWKQDAKVNEGERGFMGNKGTESSALVYLAEHFKLETWNNEEYRVYEGDTPDDLDDTKPVTGRKYKDAKNRHGTRITLTGLKNIKKHRMFTKDHLISRLSRELPVGPEFMVHVNDQEVKPYRLRTADEHVIDEVLPYSGRVHGVIYISKRPLEEDNRGVCLRVNNRGVSGMKERWDISSISQGLAAVLYAEVNADGLRDEVRGDWRGIEEGSPKFEEVYSFVRAQIRKIKTHRDNQSSYEKGDRSAQRWEEVKESATRRARRSIESNVREIYVPEPEEMASGKGRSLEGSIGYVEEHDDGSKRVVVNPRFLRAQSLDDSALEEQLGALTAFLLAYHRTEEDINKEFKTKKTRKPAMDVLEALKKNFLAQWDDMYGDSHTLEEAMSRQTKSAPRAPVSETKLYTAVEIEKLRGIRRLTINRLVECGVLDYAKVGDDIRHNQFLIGPVYDSLEKVSIHDPRQGRRFHTPVWELLRSMYSKDSNFYAAENTLNAQLDDLMQRGQIPEYLIRLGEKGKPPMYWVKEGFQDSFIEMCNSGVLDRRVKSNHSDDAKGGSNNPYVYDPKSRYNPNDWLIINETDPSTGEKIGKVRVSYTYQGEGRFFVQYESGEKVSGSFEMAAASKPAGKFKAKK
ncbi:MAG: ATP-binding protein [Nanoarchaeota archaeon]|nr:ATP-binding protein [Nanoarchaeota archaeon]